jgi:crotonobetainyl-CoA:carnitine CoA-transferase CaiB-like acyl-CoA transferase
VSQNAPSVSEIVLVLANRVKDGLEIVRFQLTDAERLQARPQRWGEQLLLAARTAHYSATRARANARASLEERSAFAANQHAIGAAARSEAWAATDAKDNKVATCSSEGASTPSALANSAVQVEASIV